MVGPRKVKLLGRADDMVIMGGVKVAPLPLEEVLRTEPRIKDAAVVGIKASNGGDLVCVALVLNNKADLAEISGGIRKLWAKYRAKITCASMDDLPRTDNGKISRAKVREFFREQPTAAGDTSLTHS
jgi:acyl-coenzyme A synthetase/AMP-(fatty) acid ligase